MSIHAQIKTHFHDADDLETAMAVMGISCTRLPNISLKDGTPCFAAYCIIINSETLCAWQSSPGMAFQFQSDGWWFSNRRAVDEIAKLDRTRIREIANDRRRHEANAQLEIVRQNAEARVRDELISRMAEEAQRAKEEVRTLSQTAAIAEAEEILANEDSITAMVSPTADLVDAADITISPEATDALSRALQRQTREKLRAAEENLATLNLILISEHLDDDDTIVLTWQG